MKVERKQNMTGNIFTNTLKHFNLVTRHRWVVFKLCCKAGIPWRGLVHDLSKFSPTEFWESVKYYNGSMSPILFAKRKQGYSKAWLHHKGRNKHHWEYWIDFSREGVVPAKMPTRYVVEMFCDRVAATMVYRGENFDVSAPLDYYNKTHGYYVIHQETDAMIKDMLVHLSKSNLEETIDYIKETYL